MVLFTGSTRAGIQVARSAAGSVKQVSQGLGGKSANILRSPFGGYKQSGNGCEWGEFGLHDFLEIKVMNGFYPA